MPHKDLSRITSRHQQYIVSKITGKDKGIIFLVIWNQYERENIIIMAPREPMIGHGLS